MTPEMKNLIGSDEVELVDGNEPLGVYEDDLDELIDMAHWDLCCRAAWRDAMASGTLTHDNVMTRLHAHLAA